jgi:aspartate racemase
MKTIGLLGGVSWHSTLEYYRLINDLINQKLGGFHSAKMQIYSFNFQEIRDLHNSSETKLCNRLVEEAQKLEKSGADCLLIGANTLHLFFDAIQSKLNIPVIHIADAIAKKIKAKGLRKVALLGTLTTMEKSFYSERLKLKNIQTIIPDVKDRKIIDSIIFNELVKGILSVDSKEIY